MRSLILSAFGAENFLFLNRLFYSVRSLILSAYGAENFLILTLQSARLLDNLHNFRDCESLLYEA